MFDGNHNREKVGWGRKRAESTLLWIRLFSSCSKRGLLGSSVRDKESNQRLENAYIHINIDMYKYIHTYTYRYICIYIYVYTASTYVER
jgi:hypothetical protein